MDSRRTKIQIYLEILQSVKNADGRLKKTHIVYKANLTHKRVQEYLDFLLSKGFLIEEKSGNQIFFVITEKGMTFLSEANKMRNVSDSFGLPLY